MMRGKKDDLLIMLVIAIHLSGHKFYLFFPNEIKWIVYDSFQSLVFFFLYLCIAFYIKSKIRRYILGWAFFMAGDFLDQVIFCEHLDFNFGFITMGLYIVVESIRSVLKYETDTEHHNTV